MEKIKISDVVKIGSYEEVDSLQLSTITKNSNDTQRLSGLILRGYETKFKDAKNANGEVFEPGCLDNFIENYFVKNNLNMPVTLMHGWDFESHCGRVLVLEVNGVGFYFVVYIPKKYKHYEDVKFMLEEGILQGFSKEGWSTDYEIRYNEMGDFDYCLIKEMEIINVSLVASPANANPFEKVQEIQNGLKFVKPQKATTIEDELFT